MYSEEQKAQPTGFFSVSCALFLVIYYLLVHNFRCSIANVIHLPHPQYWAIRFQFFRNIFFFGKVFYQPRKKILSLFFDAGKIRMQFFRCEQIVISYTMVLFEIPPVSVRPYANMQFRLFFCYNAR